MRRTFQVAAVAALALAGPAAAQDLPVPFGTYFKGPGTALGIPGVEKELGLTADQKAKLQKAAEDVQAKSDAVEKKVEKAKAPLKAAVEAKAKADVRAAEDKHLKSALKRAQHDRLEQIYRQQNPIEALADPEVAAALRLNPKQQQAAAKSLKEAAGQLATLKKQLGANAKKNRPVETKIRQLQDKTLADFLKQLAPPQKKLWDDKLFGKLYVVPPPEPAK